MEQQENTNIPKPVSLEADTSPPKPDSFNAPLQPPKQNRLKKLFGSMNIYLVLFVLILIIAGVIVALAFSQNKTKNNTIPSSEGLSNSTLQQLANSDATVGGPKEILNVESNAVFAGKVLVNQSLSVGSGLQVSGDVGLNNLNVSGNTQLQAADVLKDLTVGGNLDLNGSATVNQNLQVGGSGSFSGSLSASSVTASSLQINGELVLNHHVSVGGGSPSSSPGSALGTGGTASISGSDTAGAISLHIGGGPAAGCFINVMFNQTYNQTPYIVVSPIGSSAAGLEYYVNSSSTGFSLCSGNAAPAGSAFSFDYFIVE